MNLALPMPQALADKKRRDALALSVAALGVVFGDIGTSPLYALRECLDGPRAVTPTPAHVLGILSLVFWSLAIVISLKYLAYVLRADNHGEGGILALMALASGTMLDKPGRRRAIILLGLFGAALLYGDGMITPAISVLSAVEGLEIATPSLAPFIRPLTVAILFGLFALQRRGTASIGAVFGPITLGWFITIGILGASSLVREPGVLAAINPAYALGFLRDGGKASLLVLGSVFLVVTGGEALYADMGHLGAKPIRRTWFAVVLPALLLNYFGQGALLLRDPAAASNPFYRMAPDWLLYPLVGLATLATIIASQALITGAFSLTRQAIMLGYLPRLRVIYTSSRQAGQIYVPAINWALMFACTGLVVALRTSRSLAAAYGIAVALTMTITTLLAYFVARYVWRWSLAPALSLTLALGAIDAAFLGANALKILEGGWFPLLVATGVLVLLTTWKRGRMLLGQHFQTHTQPLDAFITHITRERTTRVSGTAVYMSGMAKVAPPALCANLAHNHVVHEHVIVLTVLTEEIARVPIERRIEIEPHAHGFCRVVARYGFMEDPDVVALLAQGNVPGYDPHDVTFFLGRETIIPVRRRPGMPLWRERLFAFMARNAQPATSLFGLPRAHVMEIGEQVEI